MGDDAIDARETEEMDQDQIITLTQEECHEYHRTNGIMSSWSRFPKDPEDILRVADKG